MKNFLQKIKFDQWKAWIYLSPAIVLLLIFTVWPIFNTLRMAFWNGYGLFKEIGGDLQFEFGIKNFKWVVGYGGFIDCLKNTMLLTVLTVPISTILALVIAVCLNAIKPFQRFLQTIFFLPYVTNSIAIGMVFDEPISCIFEVKSGGFWTAHSDTFAEVRAESDEELSGQMRDVIPESHKDGVIFGKVV